MGGGRVRVRHKPKLLLMVMLPVTPTLLWKLKQALPMSTKVQIRGWSFITCEGGGGGGGGNFGGGATFRKLVACGGHL